MLRTKLCAQSSDERRASPPRQRDHLARSTRRTVRAERVRPWRRGRAARWRCRDCRRALPACAAYSRRPAVSTDRRRTARAVRQARDPNDAPRRGAALRPHRPTRDSGQRHVRATSAVRQDSWTIASCTPVAARHRESHYVDAEAVQQLERLKIADAARNMDSHSVGRIRAGLEQHLCERQMPDFADCGPQRRPWKFRMPVPVILGVRIRSQFAKMSSDRDKAICSRWHIAMHARMARIQQRFPALRSARHVSRVRDVCATAHPPQHASPSTSAVCKFANAMRG